MDNCKVVLVGDPCTEKMSILNEHFYFDPSSREGLDNPASRRVEFNGLTVNLQIWETSGLEKYHNIINLYSKNANVVIVFFSYDDEKSFSRDNIKKYVNLLQHESGEMPILFLVGNMKELNYELIMSLEDNAQMLAKEFNAILWKISSKTYEGIDTLYQKIAMEYAKKFKTAKLYIHSIKCNLNFATLASLQIGDLCPYMTFAIKKDSDIIQTSPKENEINPEWKRTAGLLINNNETNLLIINMFNESPKGNIKLIDEVELPICKLQKSSHFDSDVFIKKGIFSKKKVGHVSFKLNILDIEEQLCSDKKPYEIEDDEVTALREQIRISQFEQVLIIGNQAKKYEEQLEKKTKEHEDEMKKKSEEYENELEKKTKEHEDEMKKKSEEYEEQLEKKTKEHEDEMKKKSEEYEEQLEKKTKEHEDEMKKKSEEYEEQLEKKTKEINEMQKKMHELIEKHDKEMKKVRKEAQKCQISKIANELKILDSNDINNLEKVEIISSNDGSYIYKVYKKRLYALKVMKIIDNDILSLRDFYSEYEIMNMLNHPNILKAYGMFFSDEKTPPSILLEYCPRNLYDAIKNHELTNVEIVKAIYQIVEGMKYVHFQKVIHRDLKPQNILIAKGGIIKICDFGISKIMSIEQSMTLGIGTENYMAPEIINGNDYNQKADIYSFGVLLFFILNNGEMPKITFLQIGNGIKAKIPESFTAFSSKLIDLCWNFDPKNRPNFCDISQMLDENEFNLIPMSEHEKYEVMTFIKQHKTEIPQYLT